jgi:hypothetical protein
MGLGVGHWPEIFGRKTQMAPTKYYRLIIKLRFFLLNYAQKVVYFKSKAVINF